MSATNRSYSFGVRLGILTTMMALTANLAMAESSTQRHPFSNQAQGAQAAQADPDANTQQQNSGQGPIAQQQQGGQNPSSGASSNNPPDNPGDPYNKWVAVSAVVQGASAVVIVVFTGLLVYYNWRLLTATEQSAQAAMTSAEVARDTLKATQAKEAARLQFDIDPFPRPDDQVDITLKITNIGQSAASLGEGWLTMRFDNGGSDDPSPLWIAPGKQYLVAGDSTQWTTTFHISTSDLIPSADHDGRYRSRNATGAVLTGYLDYWDVFRNKSRAFLALRLVPRPDGLLIGVIDPDLAFDNRVEDTGEGKH